MSLMVAIIVSFSNFLIVELGNQFGIQGQYPIIIVSMFHQHYNIRFKVILKHL